MAFHVTMVIFWMMIPTNNFTDVVEDDGRVHPLAKALTCLLRTRDEILSWMIEIWMKKHFVSDSNCNTVHL